MALTTKQKYGLGIVIVVIAILVIFGKQIMQALGLNGSTDATGTGGRRMASSLGVGQSELGKLRLSSAENMIVNKYASDLSNLGIRSQADVVSRPNDVQMIVDNMNKSFRNIGSTASVQYTGPGSTARTKCADVAVNRNCTGFVGILFGTACITWGCDKA